MRTEILHEETNAQQDALEAMTAHALSPKMDLERFLEDDYLKPQPFESTATGSKNCSDRRGASGHAWQK